MFSDEIEAKNELFGKNPSGFDYSRYFQFYYVRFCCYIYILHRAPERGWQIGKRDFSDQETYKKYHMFDHDEPYAV
jgi:small subunit ribosomal protein S17